MTAAAKKGNMSIGNDKTSDFAFRSKEVILKLW